MFIVYLTSVEKLLVTKIHVNIVTGQFDLMCSTPGTVDWVEKLVDEWDDINDDGLDKKRAVIYVNGVREGYIKKRNHLTLYTVLDAGHNFLVQNQAATNWILQQIIAEEHQEHAESITSALSLLH